MHTAGGAGRDQPTRHLADLARAPSAPPAAALLAPVAPASAAVAAAPAAPVRGRSRTPRVLAVAHLEAEPASRSGAGWVPSAVIRTRPEPTRPLTPASDPGP